MGKHYSEKLEGIGFCRGVFCGVGFYHPIKDMSLMAHRDDFTFCGMDADLKWIEGLMKRWCKVKIRAKLGLDKGDDK